ncbi:poly-beta-1,6-N-acetyl-D-glucosamine N-deacetylase PgaB [Pelosinus sp. IPA-1]|uniref:poly-beta-1,6-N-acetyl-D-glucosamine N-deacetylase PgaB n=1 Tax=Pelosinus sp. IPA-1 TaxID=3029569 RepID=UPI0024361E9B|nr:poly-beta-1,6-N-acetyl-D-glucosamine N-deacetylase PgaB [Pelosinus sp. IPA-1]GMB00753.1 poly-beta-1,6-N-acetyl-D-glucosamine N-deacetylase PgaB [Pelosinus sp. IPA-1]
MVPNILLTTALSLLLFLSFISPVIAAEEKGVMILCYHDVVEHPYNTFTITPNTLKEHFEFLKKNGYHPISLDQYIEASTQGTPLPDKPLLLTFDDGYLSFYTKVYPLLKEYNYPAVSAIVTSWADYAPPDVGKVVTWEQIREMEKSGLVSFASHSHQSHRSVTTNPQGDSGKMAESLQYIHGQYESIAIYRQRIQSDLKQSQAVFEKELGHKAKAIAWPYGSYTKSAIDIAQKEGFTLFLGLDGDFNALTPSSMANARRGIIETNLTGDKFANFLKSGTHTSKQMKAAQLDIDLIYDPLNASQTENNLALAIESLRAAEINTIFLQAFSDINGNGNIESVYFYTKEAPVRADIFSHIAAKLRKEGFTVYAWMPTLACQWLLKDRPEDTVISYSEKGQGWYNRATPFSPEVQTHLEALFSDLAAYSYIDGILFQDDLYLNDYEDFSPAAKKSFYNATGLALTPEILQDSGTQAQWTQIKTKALTDLTKKLILAMKQYRPYLATARNLYPTIITEPQSEFWLAQNYDQYLTTYDYTIVMAYPYMEKQYDKPFVWLGQLADTALKNKVNASKVVFKLQTYDWNKKQWLNIRELQQQVATLKSKHAIHFAFYPENIFSSP